VYRSVAGICVFCAILCIWAYNLRAKSKTRPLTENDLAPPWWILVFAVVGIVSIEFFLNPIISSSNTTLNATATTTATTATTQMANVPQLGGSTTGPNAANAANAASAANAANAANAASATNVTNAANVPSGLNAEPSTALVSTALKETPSVGNLKLTFSTKQFL
jgi:hypothetical protein